MPMLQERLHDSYSGNTGTVQKYTPIHGYLMMIGIDLSGLTVYKKHRKIHMDRYVLRRLFCRQISGLLPLEISQFALTCELPHENA